MLLKGLFASLRKPRAPRSADGEWLERAIRLMGEGRHTEAEAVLENALHTAPGDAGTRQLLANLALGRGHPGAALAHLDAINSAPAAETEFMRAGALIKLGRVDEALAIYRVLRQGFPRFGAGHAAHGSLLGTLGRWDEAVEALREARRLEPQSAAILNNLGNALKEAGDMRAATAVYDEALACAPDFLLACQAKLFCMHYLPDATPEALFAVARDFNTRYCAPLAAAAVRLSNVPQPERPLSIGYVSGDFRRHPVGYFIEPAIEHHDRSQFRITCYSTVGQRDDLTNRIVACADSWRDVEHLDDAALADAIRADGIDILVDLSGHTRGSRLLVFARRAAPVQATWLGYLDTTGLDAIDYIIVDPLFLPPAGSRHRLSETPLVLPQSYLCYRPPEYAPEVTALPVLQTGTIRFGCFNNLAKVNEALIGLWAKVLEAVPGAVLVLKTHGLSRESSRDWVLERFAAYGIAPDRLELHGGAPHRELLAAYGEIDVALDPFPYTGGLSTLEALWMGVPVITLAGDTLLARMGVTCVGNAGLGEFVAASPDEYVAIARRCTQDLPRLAQVRAQMRGRMLQTTLCDGAAFTRDLEFAYRRVWRRWCEGTAGHSAGTQHPKSR